MTTKATGDREIGQEAGLCPVRYKQSSSSEHSSGIRISTLGASFLCHCWWICSIGPDNLLRSGKILICQNTLSIIFEDFDDPRIRALLEKYRNITIGCSVSQLQCRQSLKGSLSRVYVDFLTAVGHLHFVWSPSLMANGDLVEITDA